VGTALVNAVEPAALGRPRDARKTEQILQAARELVLEQGINVTIEQIAAAAGVSRDAVYRRWPSRRDVVITVALQCLSDAVPIPDTGSIRGDLLSIMTAGAQGLAAGPFGRVYRSLLAEAERDPSWEPVLLAAHQQRRAVTAVVLDRAKACGEVPPGADSELLIDMISGVLWYRILVVRTPLPKRQLPELIDRALAAFGVQGAPDA
jgi:AcrR family transcriptional regulator